MNYRHRQSSHSKYTHYHARVLVHTNLLGRCITINQLLRTVSPPVRTVSVNIFAGVFSLVKDPKCACATPKRALALMISTWGECTKRHYDRTEGQSFRHVTAICFALFSNQYVRVALHRLLFGSKLLLFSLTWICNHAIRTLHLENDDYYTRRLANWS